MHTLAICIPTYGRAALLAELLADLVEQADDRVEVIVADDASPDDTIDVLRSFEGRLPRLRVIAHAQNVGLDLNFLATVEAATSDYIWLMGDDDRIEPGGVARVLEALDQWPAVTGLTLGVVDYDVTMQHPVGLRATPPTGLLHGDAAVFEALADLLGFMSALVISRQDWHRIAGEPATESFRNYYVQVYIAGRAIGLQGTWGVVHDLCVRFRTANDQLQGRFGWVDRLRIDVLAYRQITRALFSDRPATRRAVDARILSSHPTARIVNAITDGASATDRAHATGLLIHEYWSYPAVWLRLLPLLCTPRSVLRLGRSQYQRLSGRSGAARARSLGSTRSSG